MSNRRSKRTKTAICRYDPAGPDNSTGEVMLHEMATAAASKSAVPLAPDAIEELKRCLQPAIETFVQMAFNCAADKKRDAPTDADWEEVLKQYKKSRKT